ncbi:MAG TPA: penicillin-binding protein activator [Pseudomonadales bacterium]|nr:penicillin-binding protein activator [Pseudomonadales bacterium]
MPIILPCRLLLRRLALAIAVLAFVAGCAHDDTVQTTDPTIKVTEPVQEEKQPAKPQETAYSLLQQAETAVSPQRESLLLQAANLYQQQGDNTRVGKVLQEVDANTLTGELLVRYSLLYGDWALTERHLDDAARVLLNQALSGMTADDGMDKAGSARLHALRARLYELQQKPLDALHELLVQSLLVPESGQLVVNEAIWRLLSMMSPDDFRVLEYADTSNNAEEQLLAGWLALARVERDHPGDLDKQTTALKDWERSYPVHPANRFKPVDMAMLEQTSGEQPQRVALLLPLTGKREQAGQAVRDGFMTMHYQHLAAGDGNLQIDVVDSNAAPDILTAYNNAVAQGAKLVIGPLEREQVQVLASQTSLPVPTLALNNPPGQASAPLELYQFSLNPEEEAAQVADTASSSQLHRALVISPQGERGERLTQAFNKRWKMMGGELAAVVRYVPNNGNYGAQLADALGIDLASGQLKPGKMLPDMVFFVGTGSDAAVVMEALAKNGAGKLPVYATSQVFTGQKLDTRTDGLRLCLAPWQAGTGPLRTQGDVPAGADILFAMGADAQVIYTKLSQMSVNSSLHVPGNTGYLSMDGDRKIVRTLVWGVLKDGQLQVQPTAVGRF